MNTGTNLKQSYYNYTNLIIIVAYPLGIYIILYLASHTTTDTVKLMSIPNNNIIIIVMEYLLAEQLHLAIDQR